MSDTLRAALANLLAHAERANEIMLHEAGIGVIDLNALHAARAALASPQAEPVQAQPVAWQPIATAPKNEAVLVRCSHGMYVAEWREFDIEYWHVDDNKHGPFPLRGAAPTHWMPLPEPPDAAARPQAEQAEGEQG